jgi:hypothetical protein
MKQNIFAAAALMAAVLCMSASSVQAQSCNGCGGKLKRVASNALHGTGKLASVFNGGGATFDGEGRVQPSAGCVNPRTTLKLAAQDHFSPNPVYAYSSEGARAGRTHSWNQGLQNQYSWHGEYNTWRYGQPTAVVVPPTASYQSTYAWGVGQTRSTPIHHQFGRGAGSSGGSAGGYQNTPYFPSNTNQFGYYPVRANW